MGKSHLIKTKLDASSVPAKKFLQTAFKISEGSEVAVHVDASEAAMKFYLLNHALAAAEQENLRDAAAKIGEWYYELAAEELIRMVAYFGIITVREMRHGSSIADAASKLKSQSKVVKEFFNTLANKPNSINSKNERTSLFLALSGGFVGAGDFYSDMAEMYELAGFSSGYGGTAWKTVTEVLRAYLKGEITGEVFMDTAFAAAHNNGTVFNKPYVYSGATSIQLVLDVQRAGQMPAFLEDIIGRGIMYMQANQPVIDIWTKLKALMPDSDIWNPVDWSSVAAASEQGNSWSGCKDKQEKKLGAIGVGLTGNGTFAPMAKLNKHVVIGEAKRK